MRKLLLKIQQFFAVYGHVAPEGHTTADTGLTGATNGMLDNVFYTFVLTVNPR